MFDSLRILSGASWQSWNLNLPGCHGGKAIYASLNSKKKRGVVCIGANPAWMCTLNFTSRVGWIQMMYCSNTTTNATCEWLSWIPANSTANCLSLIWINLGKHACAGCEQAFVRSLVLLLRCFEAKLYETRFCLCCPASAFQVQTTDTSS